jgi:hypothetical protein
MGGWEVHVLSSGARQYVLVDTEVTAQAVPAQPTPVELGLAAFVGLNGKRAVDGYGRPGKCKHLGVLCGC